jgi:hypothetical protein
MAKQPDHVRQRQARLGLTPACPKGCKQIQYGAQRQAQLSDTKDKPVLTEALITLRLFVKSFYYN